MTNKRKALGNGLEQRVVDRARYTGLDAHKQPMSGQLKEYPNDAVIEKTLVECKARTAQIDAKGQRYLRVDLEWLRDVEAHAKESGFEGGVLVVNAKYSSTPKVLIDLEFFLKLMKQRKNGFETADFLDWATTEYLDNPQYTTPEPSTRRLPMK